jgi:hypothetical protein
MTDPSSQQGEAERQTKRTRLDHNQKLVTSPESRAGSTTRRTDGQLQSNFEFDSSKKVQSLSHDTNVVFVTMQICATDSFPTLKSWSSLTVTSFSVAAGYEPFCGPCCFQF